MKFEQKIHKIINTVEIVCVALPNSVSIISS